MQLNPMNILNYFMALLPQKSFLLLNVFATKILLIKLIKLFIIIIW